jgi:NADPH:quinone reductase-like Zn-dependent oxidoreductase
MMHSPITAQSRLTTQTMRATVYTDYGLPRDVLRMTEVERPVPDADGLLIKVQASSVNALDWRLITGTPFIARISDGIRKPSRHVPGADISGTIEAVGADVDGHSPGDEVFAEIPGGGFAEYVAVAADKVAPKPINVGFEESATLGVAALTALQGLRDWGNLQPGQSVLINGASGGVGTFAIQIARALGASEITAVCSTDKVEIARTLGADHVIDYTREDFTRVAGAHDLLFDNAGMNPYAECRRVIAADGTHVMITGPMKRWFGPVRRILWSALRAMPEGRTFVGGKTAQQSTNDLLTLKQMVEAGTVTPVMDRRFSLDEAVEALHHQGEGHARGKSVVIP